jgi:hypothetical protein
MHALPHAEPGHKISCVPGLHELTMKDRLVARLTQFYGEGAFDIIPRSYLLPTQYWPWRMWLANQVRPFPALCCMPTRSVRTGYIVCLSSLGPLFW